MKAVAGWVGFFWVQAVAATAMAQGQLPPNHPPLPSSPSAPAVQAGNDADILPWEQVKATPDKASFEVASKAGKTLFARGRYAEALPALKRADAAALNLMKTLVGFRKRTPAPSPQAVGCPPEDASLEDVMAAAAAKARSGAADVALACLERAAAGVLEVQLLAAKAMAIEGDLAGAQKMYSLILESFPKHEAAMFGMAATKLEAKPDDVESLRQAKKGFSEYIAAHPQGVYVARARNQLTRLDALIAAGGTTAYAQRMAKDAKASAPAVSSMGAASPPPLAPETVKALQENPRSDAELEKDLEEGEEHLSKARFQEALDSFKKVMPYRPSPRVQAGMAWSLVGLNRQPMADRIWSVAVKTDPSALDKLGDALKAKGDEKGAQALWKRLAQTDPSYAAKLAGKLQ